ncbi:protein WVD2-like 7 [Arachis stenosperma]|uniref:protein WVD2-like 7 n=1 Tax=Arachis stenosperma TaxID=217475 RepID=UPI0025AC56C9|nr:protein WVD2-like 7 [Arachis stenosperma]XP_057761499.1 protein WVD2-like 7 [Arachis stenosperma]XP_057761501.1 protein WVD2-like 7 [Arachis stenosperma]XP_057761502.1 protein WVD2-like 7 [Arachis stenosperma]
MGETSASNDGLQASVSLGRFENDSLSWERWSSFSPNKYMEEVEKCATPGSVAQKKAYFEAHYKKIAARKAELLAQEKQNEDQNGMHITGENSGAGAVFDVFNKPGYVEVVKIESSSVDEISRSYVVSRDYVSSSAKAENEELKTGSHSSQLTDKPEEVVSTKQEESIDVEVEDVKKISHVVYKVKETGNAAEVEVKELTLDHTKNVEAKHLTLDHPREYKVTPIKRESNVAKTKKTSMRPTPKISQISTPRSSSSKPTLTQTKLPASSSSTKNADSPSLSRKQIASSGQSRKVANKSLHMSMSLGLSNHDPAPHSTVGKSLIMQKMGDKDIVRRAFKTFQNNYNQPNYSGEDRSLVKRQVPARGTKPKVSTSTAPQKENGQPTKVESIDRRSADSVQATSVLRRDVRAEKGKESFRKIEEKSNTKMVVERTHLQPKIKEEKEAEIKKIKPNFKAYTSTSILARTKSVKDKESFRKG